MLKLKSRIPMLLEKKGWNEHIFVAHMMILDVSRGTSEKLARGDLNVYTKNLEAAATVLGVRSISEIMELESRV